MAKMVATLVLALLCGMTLFAVPSQKKNPPAKPLDLNKATVEELQQVPGIGASLAKSIVRFREKSGPFRRVEDLLAVRGITKAKLEKIRPYLRVADPSPEKKPEGARLHSSPANEEMPDWKFAGRTGLAPNGELRSLPGAFHLA